MDISHVPFDPTDVRARINPSFVSDDPFKIDTQQFVGHTIYLDPRRVMGMDGQPRQKFVNIEQFAEEIRTDGQKTAIQVHPISHPDFDVELQAGERRTRACVLAKLMIRAEIRPVPADRSEHFDDAFIENFNREDLTLLETVESVEKLLANGRPWQDIARMAGKSKTWVDQYTTLVRMDPAVRELMKEQNTGQSSERGRKLRRKTALPLSIWLHIAKMPKEQQLPFARRMVEGGVTVDTVRYLVQNELARQGEILRKRSPSELAGVLERETGRVARLYDRYLGMSPRALQAMFSSKETSYKLGLANKMRTIAFHLRGLAEVISPLKTEADPTADGPINGSEPTSLPGIHPGLQRWIDTQLNSLRESGMSMEQWMDQQLPPSVPQVKS